MADSEKQTIEKLKPLVAKLRELQTDIAAVTDEIDALLGGGAGIGALLKRLEETFGALWRSRYGVPFFWTYTKDRPQMKRLIKALPVEEIEARMSSFLKNQDPYFVGARHTFSLFVATINNHAGLAAPADLALSAPPVGCRHTPACVSDQACTKKKAAEVRG
jgi:hypothetical protein